MLLSIKHLSSVFHGIFCVPFFFVIIPVLEHVPRLRRNVESDVLQHFLVFAFLMHF